MVWSLSHNRCWSCWAGPGMVGKYSQTCRSGTVRPPARIPYPGGYGAASPRNRTRRRRVAVEDPPRGAVQRHGLAGEGASRVRITVDAEPGSGVEKSRSGAHVDGHIITEGFAPVTAGRISKIQMLLLLLGGMLYIYICSGVMQRISIILSKQTDRQGILSLEK